MSPGAAPFELRHEEVRALLAQYARVVRAAEEVHGLVWVRTRPPGTAACARWWRLPRPTVGLRILVVRHVTRSVDTLSRAYARRAALDELDEQGVRTRQMVADYRAALPPIPWKTVVALSALAGLLVTRALVGAGVDLAAHVLRVNAPAGEQQEALTRVVDGLVTFSTTFSPAGLVDQLAGAGQVGLAGVLVLAVLLLVAAYVVLRPMSAVFRVKRMLFNLCDDPDLRRTASTWHVPRAVGLYAHERSVFGAAGCVVPAEPSLDLALGLLGAFLTCGFVLRLYVFDPETDRLLLFRDGAAPGDYGVVLLVLLLAGARVVWLLRAMRSRRAGTTPSDGVSDVEPSIVVLAATARLVERRSPLEVFGLLAATSVAFVGWLVVPFTFSRLWAQIHDADREVGPRALGARWHPYRSFAVAGVAVASAVASPVVACVLAWRVVRSTTVRVRGGSAFLGLAALAAVAWSLALRTFFLPSDDEALGVSLLVIAVTVGLTGAVAQHVANEAVARQGQPWVGGVLPEQVVTEFRVPPSWPAPPVGWSGPAPGFLPDPSWGEVPGGWRFWSAPGGALPLPVDRPEAAAAVRPSVRDRRLVSHALAPRASRR
ncbi:hypothetical protein Cch01nite_21580 [Cellulomonas chitinilytica]|uniref:Uncharacterized protein n=1 Tax=Cellulomonas chitinilytica TaxID=398759 RepID=A0A919P5M6_9CELL|nr:hypothetical protein Cch01nite_21580 [Cellulomonas chitinilytica]